MHNTDDLAVAELEQVGHRSVHPLADLDGALGRGDVATILAMLAPDVSWELEGPAEISYAGIRKKPEEAELRLDACGQCYHDIDW
ncbi:MAG: hypothetical protein ACRD4E_12135 [Bryobacteraceae bacterium]